MTDPTIAALIEADKHRTPGRWHYDDGRVLYMLDREQVIAFASRIREEAIRECDAAVRNIEPGTLNISKPQASSTILSLIEKKP